MKRAWFLVPVVLLAAVALVHPPAGPVVAVSTASPAPPGAHHRRSRLSPARSTSSNIVVYVVGAVARPGLYRLAAGARNDEALGAAGGFAPQADRAAVNLAAHANDGDEIDVPLIGETPHSSATHAKLPRGTRSKRATKSVSIVALNSADAAELAQVPGIGATIATRIVDVREHDGPFSTFDELLDVAGMTPARLDRAQQYLRL